MTGQTISHYRILEKLGEGGMGVVYKAEDTKLRRTVALKFLPPDNRERFLREAQAAAALNHPNICTVFEIDEEHGFLAIELIDGMSVKDKIAARLLPLEEALDIAQQACAGLAAAHEKGIVHRDIKPANLMLTAQGQVKIMDFGLAQVGDRTRITKTGSSLGTPAYMSPEQAQGNAVDRRTDIWSLGVVLYEMIAGRLPFRGDTEQAVSYGIVHSEPEPLTALRSGLPKELDRIAAKVLRKNPAERYSHVEDLLVDLRAAAKPIPSTARSRSRAPVLAMIVLVLAAAGWFGWTGLRPAPPSTARSLAVLPFRLLTASSADDYLGVGMADSVISKVSQIPGLTVRPTGAVRKFSAADTDTMAAARMLGVDAVLDGNLQRNNDRLRVSVNLIDVASGASLWADTFNVAAADIFTVQDEVALRVAGQLRYRLDASQQARMVHRHTSNPLAFEYYQKGMRGLERRMTMSDSEFESVIALFRRAIDADPNYALAHAQLAFTYSVLAVFRVPGNPAWIDLAREEIQRAERLDRDLAETHIVRSTILSSIHGNFRLAEAIQERQLARRLNPSLADPELGNLYSHVGLDERALRQVSRALQIDPLNESAQRQRAFVLGILERHAEVVAEHQRLFNRPGPPISMAILGRLDEAEPLIEADIARRPQNPEPHGDWALLQALRGRFSQIEPKIPAIQSGRSHRQYHHATYCLAQAYGLQGKAREAVRWLRETAETGMPNYPVFARDPLFAKIRQSPEYAAFMAELKPRWEKLVREIEEH